jgi:hypothetical protein
VSSSKLCLCLDWTYSEHFQRYSTVCTLQYITITQHMFVRRPSIRALSMAACIFGAASYETVLAVPSLDVTLTSGIFRGVANSNGTDAWLGIPFAQPPIGPLRFKAPLPITQLSQVIQDASRFGDACPQPPSSTLGADISENCLFLNVCSISLECLVKGL